MSKEKLTRDQMILDNRWRIPFLASSADPMDPDVRYYIDGQGRLTQDFVDSQGNILRSFWLEERFEWVGEDDLNLDWDS